MEENLTAALSNTGFDATATAAEAGSTSLLSVVARPR